MRLKWGDYVRNIRAAAEVWLTSGVAMLRYGWVCLLLACGEPPPNQLPSVEILGPITGRVMRGIEVTVEFELYDEDDDVTELDYVMTLDNLVLCQGKAEAEILDCVTELPLDRSTAMLSVLVSDPDGGVGDANQSVRFLDPSPPIVGALRTVPVEPQPAQAVELIAVVGSGSTRWSHLRVDVESDLDGVLVEGAVPELGRVSTVVTLSEGMHEVRVTATDPSGPVTEKSFTL